jgi:hypothetical protein
VDIRTPGIQFSVMLTKRLLLACYSFPQNTRIQQQNRKKRQQNLGPQLNPDNSRPNSGRKGKKPEENRPLMPSSNARDDEGGLCTLFFFLLFFF